MTSIDFQSNEQDRECARLAILGRSVRSIAIDCDLTEEQVRYRLYRVGRIKIKAYRNGVSDVAKFLAEDKNVRRASLAQLAKQLSKINIWRPSLHPREKKLL